MKGVNVKIIISLDVKTVKIETITYNVANNLNCESLYFFIKTVARYPKKPV